MSCSDDSIARIIFNRLIGDWELERHIIDRSAKDEVHGYLHGQTSFKLIDDGKLFCEESGILKINGNETNASRSYVYEYRDGKVLVFYDDPHRKGDLLHELDFQPNVNGYAAKHCHLCGSDTYDVEILVSDKGYVQINYVVKGPHKDYEMQTTLTPK